MKRYIRDKIRSALNVVNGLMIAVGIIGLLALLAAVHGADQAVEAGVRMNTIGLEIRTNSRQSSEFGKEFLLNRRTKGFEKTRQERAWKVAASLARIEELCDEGVRIAPLETDRERFRTIRTLAGIDAKGFADLVTADVVLAEVDAKMAVYQEGSHQLENASDEVAKAGLKANQQSLASAATAVWIAIQLVVLSSVGAIGAATRYGSRISANIVRPVSLGHLNLKVNRTLRRRRRRSPGLSGPQPDGRQILPG